MSKETEKMLQQTEYNNRIRNATAEFASKAGSSIRRIIDNHKWRGILLQILFILCICISLLHLIYVILISVPEDLFEDRNFITKWILIIMNKLFIPTVVLSFIFFGMILKNKIMTSIRSNNVVHEDSEEGFVIFCPGNGNNCSLKEKALNTYLTIKKNKTYTIMAIFILTSIVFIILIGLNVFGSPMQNIYELNKYTTNIGDLKLNPITSWFYNLWDIVMDLLGYNEESYKNYKDTYDYENEKEAEVLDNIINERYNKDVSMEQLKRTSVYNRLRGDYEGDKSPKCSQIRNYEQCVNGVANGICNKLDKDNCETATDSSGVQLCSYDTENKVCKTKKKYYDRPCQYNISENDICVPLFNTDDNFHQLLGKEYVNNEKNEIYFDKCSSLKVNGDICNAIEISHSANEVYEMLINDMENGTKIKSKTGLSINLNDINTREKISKKCYDGAEITLCMKQENPANFTDLNGDDITIDPLHIKEYTINYGGSTDKIHVVMEDEEIINCSELTPSILKGDQTEDKEGYYQYVCKNPDMTNDQIGKYCTITNSDDSQEVCSDRYSGLIQNPDEGSVNYYNIVDSKACNLLGDRTVVKQFMNKVKNPEESDKNVMACAENFPLKENAFSDPTNQVYIDMISIIKDDYSKKGFSTIYKSGDNKYMFPYQLSNPTKTFEDGSNYSMYIDDDDNDVLFKQYGSGTLNPKIDNDDLQKKVKGGNTVLVDYIKAEDATIDETANEYSRDISVSCSSIKSELPEKCVENCSVNNDKCE